MRPRNDIFVERVRLSWSSFPHLSAACPASLPGRACVEDFPLAVFFPHPSRDQLLRGSPLVAACRASYKAPEFHLAPTPRFEFHQFLLLLQYRFFRRFFSGLVRASRRPPPLLFFANRHSGAATHLCSQRSSQFPPLRSSVFFSLISPFSPPCQQDTRSCLL